MIDTEVRSRFADGDHITHATVHGPILKVLLEVEGQYVLESPEEHRFLRPVPWVDDNFWQVAK